MADTKGSLLPALSGANAADNDIVPVIDVSAGASGSKSMLLSELLTYMKTKGISLNDLSDAVITSPTTGEYLYYNGSEWVNLAAAAASITVDSTDIANSTATEVQTTLEDLDDAITNASAAGMPATLFDAAGDIIVASAADTAAKLAKGSDGTVLGVTGGTVGYAKPRYHPMTLVADTSTAYTHNVFLPGVLLTLSNASAITLTIDTNANVAWDVGAYFDFMQLGAGQVTVSPAVGVTINTSSSYKTRTQYSVCRLVKTATNTWILLGDLEPVGRTINAQTGTTYTFALGDMDRLVTASNASAQTYTVPPNADVAFPTGISIDIAQIGAGQVTIAQGSGVTVNATPTLKLRAQYSGATLTKTATNTWLLHGDLAAV